MDTGAYDAIATTLSVVALSSFHHLRLSTPDINLNLEIFQLSAKASGFIQNLRYVNELYNYTKFNVLDEIVMSDFSSKVILTKFRSQAHISNFPTF